MRFDAYLNEEQLRAVETKSQYAKVVAGAGSGKTRVLTFRIAHLIVNENVIPRSILGVTFTNKAAKEIKDRVYKLLPELQEGNNDVQLSTIHSWCARFLRYNAKYIDYPRNFTILDEDDQLLVMKNIFKSHDLPKNDPHIKECLNWIGSKKTEGIQYKDIENQNYPSQLINQFKIYYKEYTEYLRKTASLDFDDLLLKTIEILENKEINVRKAYQNSLSHILVDEFQDINDVQFHLISLLMNENTSLYVVGDTDQTIYTWRGANHKIMLDLERRLRYEYKDANVETLFLNNNYRSSKNILDCANKLIVNNTERDPKNLRAINDAGEQVSYHLGRTIGEETSYIASTIKEKAGYNRDYRKFAVLYRSNYLTRELESQLNLHRIPYKIFGGQKFYQRREIKDVIAYLNLVVNELDDVSLERIINVPKRNIGPTSIDALRQEANEAGQSMYLYIKESSETISLPKSKIQQLNKFVDSIENLKLLINTSNTLEFGDIIEKYLNDIGYMNYLEDEPDGDDRKENVLELIGTIREFFKANEEATYEDFITNAALQASQDEVEDGNYVSLMTVHTAKGLEFENVFIYGFNDGIFPSRRAIEESKRGIEEERRLAYVAVTRAKKKLYLTCNVDFSHVLSTKLTPSRFFKEMGFNFKSNSHEERYMNSYINPYYASSYKKVEPKKVVQNQTPLTNGVKSWNVGDMLEHEQFGVGKVQKVVSDKLIEVRFEKSEHGVKTLLGSHYKIKKLLN